MNYLPQSKLAAWRKANTPKECPILGVKMQNPAVDHNHSSGFIRGVLSSEGNAFMGRVENAHKRLSKHGKGKSLSDVLRRMADFLEQPDLPILHPVGATQLGKRFKTKKVEEQIAILEGLRQIGKKTTTEEILSLRNSTERANLYLKLIKE